MDMLYRLPAIIAVALMTAFPPAYASTELVLTITACSRNRCEDAVVVPPEGTSMMSCVRQGQLVAKQWVDNNKPGWSIRRYRCGHRSHSA